MSNGTCRACGLEKKVYTVSRFITKHREKFEAKFQNDIQGIHPPVYFCLTCGNKLKPLAKKRSAAADDFINSFISQMKDFTKGHGDTSDEDEDDGQDDVDKSKDDQDNAEKDDGKDDDAKDDDKSKDEGMNIEDDGKEESEEESDLEDDDTSHLEDTLLIEEGTPHKRKHHDTGESSAGHVIPFALDTPSKAPTASSPAAKKFKRRYLSGNSSNSDTSMTSGTSGESNASIFTVSQTTQTVTITKKVKDKRHKSKWRNVESIITCGDNNVPIARASEESQQLAKFFQCKMCKKLPFQPIELSQCHHIFCRECAHNLKDKQHTACFVWYKSEGDQCFKRSQDIIEPTFLMNKAHNEIYLDCPKCDNPFRIADYKEHTKKCTRRKSTKFPFMALKKKRQQNERIEKAGLYKKITEFATENGCRPDEISFMIHKKFLQSNEDKPNFIIGSDEASALRLRTGLSARQYMRVSSYTNIETGLSIFPPYLQVKMAEERNLPSNVDYTLTFPCGKEIHHPAASNPKNVIDIGKKLTDEAGELMSN